MKNYSLMELSNHEMQSINGGWMGFVGLLIAGFALGYEIGKSAAERERAK